LRRFGISSRYLLYTGQWRKHKNLANLMRAYALLKKKTDLPHELVLTGQLSSQAPEVPELIKKLNLERDVIITGFVPDEELAALYSAADLFVFPSLYEGFGIPPLEAMACGCPVVASNVSSIPEILGDAALFFDPLSVEDMAGAIHKALSSFNLRRELKAKGFERIKKFSYAKMARETLKTYQEVLSQ
jgi:glycosyltransferase involved in cell wall biosynthesis